MDPRYYAVLLRLAVGLMLFLWALVGVAVHLDMWMRPKYDYVPLLLAVMCFLASMLFLAMALNPASWPKERAENKERDDGLRDLPRYPVCDHCELDPCICSSVHRHD